MGTGGMYTRVEDAPESWKALPPLPSEKQRLTKRSLFGIQILLFVGAVTFFVMLYKSFALGTAIGCVSGAALSSSRAHLSDTPQYFQTKPELFAGPTPTGPAPFLAQTNPAPFLGTSYIPNSPLETQIPIAGNKNGSNIFQMMGQLSHYFPNPVGFGVDEYSLPPGSEIVQLNMLSRHGSRYPTTGSGAFKFGQKHKNMTGDVKYTGELSFLNDWNYQLGAEILVPIGKQELFDSGTLHYYQYGHLYPNNGSKIIARSTTQDRMTKSAEYFLAGFFGLEWPTNVTLLLAIEDSTGVWNNSLAGYYNCNNSNNYRSAGGNNATIEWYEMYLADATARLQKLAPGFGWTPKDSYDAQSLCAYETVAYGYSQFCGLFTYEEWQGYEYSIDIQFAGNNAFQSPTGRAVGIGYVQEVLARLQHHTIDSPIAQINVTLDNNTATFPLDQSLNFDFSHDTNIMSILTAFGFTQFAQFLPSDRIVPHELVVSHLEPFAARLDIEIINAPAPVKASRNNTDLYEEGKATKYIHFILNQRTIPLHRSFPDCEERDDGWCELDTFLAVQSKSFEISQYDWACNGDYEAVPYGEVTNGVPTQMSS
ncbi:phosphoglycerate mutase-like protein [Aureobasidium pullulans]|nr:phosphoglycerate mutase-like protein [Aureobasidium pullulans]